MAQTDPNQRPSRRGRFWPLLIVGLLTAHVVGMVGTAVYVSRNAGEMAVIPDYYSKAQAWDSYKQELAASDKLGWSVLIQPVAQMDPIGRQQLQVDLLDESGKSIRQATVQVHCFHLSHGNEAQDFSPAPNAHGLRLIPIPPNRQGFWEFDITAQARGKAFIKTITQYVD